MGDEPATGRVSPKKIIVLGGGLAGLSAARRLLEHGFSVTLVEKRPFLGGRAFSFREGEGDDTVEVDNGQHVFLGCNSYYRDYLDAIGATDKTYLPDKLHTKVVRNGVSATLASKAWLGRLHLLPSFLAYPHIGLKDKLLVVYGLLVVKLTRRSKRSADLDSESFYDWLKRHGQTDRSIDNLWNLFILPALNDDIRDVSADMGLMVFQEALLKGPKDASIGLARVGLTSLNGEPAQRYIEAKGGELALGRSVSSVLVNDGRVSGLKLSNGDLLEGDAYISALPHKTLLEVLPEEASSSPHFSVADELDSSPIVGIHLWYDREIMDEDFVAFLESPVQWVFNKNFIQDRGSENGQYVCVSLSGAWAFSDVPKEKLIEQFTAEMARLFPRAADATLERFHVVKELNATFRSLPGAAKHRLPQATPIPNLYLAGDWTQTGWPATMESAVRSGVFAADLVAERERSAAQS